jgi:hypothetical protein
MKTPFEEIFADFTVEPPATEQVIEAVEKTLGKPLPSDYREFLLQYNGGEGFIGKHYLILWKADELIQFNRDYQVHDYAPGFFMFGSTGGGDGYAFDTRINPYRIMQVPFIGMSLEDGFSVADSFRLLLERMIVTDGPLF